MINDQMPPGMPPEMPEGMPPEMPPMPEAPMPPQGMPPEQGMIQTPFQSDALQVDEEAVNDAARKIIASSKNRCMATLLTSSWRFFKDRKMWSKTSP